MKRFLQFAALIAAITMTISCEDDEQKYVAPVFDKLVLTPNPCEPGDSVRVVAAPNPVGENWYFYKFNFSVDGNSVFAYMKNGSTNTWNSKEASCLFIAPKTPGNHTVSFSGSVSPIVGSKLYDGINPCTETLVVKGTVVDDEEEE